MKIAIVVYSETGHTLDVSEKLKTALEKDHDVVLFRIRSDERRSVVYDTPELKGFEHIVIATPVQGFQPAVPMALLLEQVFSLKGTTASILLTQYFPWACLGGNITIRKLMGLIQSKGGHVAQTAIVHWSSKKREQQIAAAVAKLSNV